MKTNYIAIWTGTAAMNNGRTEVILYSGRAESKPIVIKKMTDSSAKRLYRLARKSLVMLCFLSINSTCVHIAR
jgi:hypothetical protein